MNKIGNYELMASIDPQHMTEKIQEKIALGWQPFGAPFSAGNLFYQAIVRDTALGRLELEEIR